MNDAAPKPYTRVAFERDQLRIALEAHRKALADLVEQCRNPFSMDFYKALAAANAVLNPPKP